MKKLDQGIKNLEGSVKEMETAKMEHEKAISNLQEVVKIQPELTIRESRSRLLGFLDDEYKYLRLAVCVNCHAIAVMSDDNFQQLFHDRYIGNNGGVLTLCSQVIHCCDDPDFTYRDVIFAEVVEVEEGKEVMQS